jgi:hypothetical protein
MPVVNLPPLFMSIPLYTGVGETVVDNCGERDDSFASGHQGWWRSINKNFGHPVYSEQMQAGDAYVKI